MPADAHLTDRPLHPHPATPGPGIGGLHGRATRHADGLLHLQFTLSGHGTILRLPEPGPAERADGLWRHTCFAAFVRTPGARRYLELNASPSTAWAVYAFDDYRAGMRALAPEPPPAVRGNRGTSLTIEVTLPLDTLGLAPDGALELGLAAVLESTAGSLSYWALSHAAEEPDFHHPGSFVLTLPPPTPE